MLKFDRLSRSIRHFCELYETYFKSGEKELVAILGIDPAGLIAGPRAREHPVWCSPRWEREATADGRAKRCAT